VATDIRAAQPVAAAVFAAVVGAVAGAAIWVGRPFLPHGGGVAAPDLEAGSVRGVVALPEVLALLGADARSVAAGSGALAAGTTALLLAECGAGAGAALAAAAAMAIAPASGQPLGALLCGVWLLCVRLRRRPARWRAALAGCFVAGLALMDVAALLLLPILLWQARDAYPRGVRAAPLALLGGFGAGGWLLLAALAVLVRDIGGVGVRLRHLTELKPEGFLARAGEALWPANAFAAVAAGRAGAADFGALAAMALAVALLVAGAVGLVRARRMLWPARRATGAAALATLALLGAVAALRPSSAAFPWTPALAAGLWLWAVGVRGLDSARARVAAWAGLPVALALIQLLR